MKIFGIDPGSERTGYGCVESIGSRQRERKWRRSIQSAGASFPEKLRQIHHHLSALLAECAPDCVAIENLSASESRIRDTDMAQEMMSFTRSQILSQAGTAMLAQANQASQGVLSLLR